MQARLRVDRHHLGGLHEKTWCEDGRQLRLGRKFIFLDLLILLVCKNPFEIILKTLLKGQPKESSHKSKHMNHF